MTSCSTESGIYKIQAHRWVEDWAPHYADIYMAKFEKGRIHPENGPLTVSYPTTGYLDDIFHSVDPRGDSLSWIILNIR